MSVLEAASPAEQSVGLRLSAANSLLHSQLFNSNTVAVAGAAGTVSAELVLVHLRASVVALTLLQVCFVDTFIVLVFCRRSICLFLLFDAHTKYKYEINTTHFYSFFIFFSRMMTRTCVM